jgi:hypothetical protein
VERFKLVVFISLVVLSSLSNGHLDTFQEQYNMGCTILTIFMSELIVDWVKHAFITKVCSL